MGVGVERVCLGPVVLELIETMIFLILAAIARSLCPVRKPPLLVVQIAMNLFLSPKRGQDAVSWHILQSSQRRLTHFVGRRNRFSFHHLRNKLVFTGNSWHHFSNLVLVSPLKYLLNDYWNFQRVSSLITKQLIPDNSSLSFPFWKNQNE